MAGKSNMIKTAVLIAANFLSCFFFSAWCQQPGKNLAVFNNVHNSDTVLIKSFLDKGKALATSFPDSSAVYYDKAESLALALKNKHLLKTAMALHIKLLNNQSKFEYALALALQHISVATQLQAPSILLQAYNEAANEYEYLGNYEPAADYYIKALKLAIATNDKRMRRKLNNNISSVFLSLKDYNTAYVYSARAFNMAATQQDTVTMGNCLINMGLSELHREKYKQALLHFEEAEKIGWHIPDVTLVADALSDQGLVYYTMHNLSAAEKYYKAQKAIADTYHLDYEKLYAVFQLALVVKEKKNLIQAEHLVAQAIAIGERLGTADELMEMYDTMSVIKQETGDLKGALFYRNKYETINDSLRNQEVQTNIHALNIQFRSAQKDKQIAEQNLSIEKDKAAMARKNTWIFIFFGSIIALTIILILSLYNYQHKQKLHQQLLRTLQKENEVNTLKAKMQAREEERGRIAREMHDDIGSALTTILYLSDDLKTQNETAVHAAEKIAGTAGAVVDKMNEIIWSMNTAYDTYDDLIAYTRRHAAEFLQDHHLQYQLNIPGSVPQLRMSGEQRRNIYLIIKEALHNIVKHACATEVIISFMLNENLHITIHDNGKGISRPSPFGNGLNNMRRRMEAIGGSFEICNEAGTTVKLTFPLDVSDGSKTL
jgi:signal transduction histidine kinase